jgi:UDP:flavonoid glycosyltransferase YjiC (YdhE family)
MCCRTQLAPTRQLRRELAEIDERLVRAREFVLLPALLRSCKVVISHAGAGTVLGALAFGVPVVLMPRGTPSQLRMADACHRAGVGRRCGSADLDAALDEVINNPAITAAAFKVARQIAELPNASSVAPLIASLASGRTE